MATRGNYLLVFVAASVVLAASVIYLGFQIFALADRAWLGGQILPPAPRKEAGAKVEVPVQSPLPPAWRPGAISTIAPRSPAEMAGLIVGDRVVSVDGIPLEDLERVRKRAAELRIGDVVAVEIARTGENRKVSVRLDSPLHSFPFVFGLLTSLALAVVFVGTALFVVLKRPFDLRALLFYLVAVVLANLYLHASLLVSSGASAIGLYELSFGGGPGTVALVVSGVATLLLGPLLLHFALVFPRERAVLAQNKRLLWLVYGMVATPYVSMLLLALTSAVVPQERYPLVGRAVVFVVSAVLFAALMVRISRAAGRVGYRRAVYSKPFTLLAILALTTSLYASGLSTALEIFVTDETLKGAVRTYGGVLFIVLFLLAVALFYPLATCIALYRSYRESALEERTQVRWPLWGTIVGLAGPFAVGMVVMVLGWVRPADAPTTTLAGEIVGKAFYACIPLSFTFAILKYRLMDIDLLIRRTIVYGALTGIVLLVYLLLVGGVGGLLVRTVGIEGPWVTIGATLLVAALLVPVRSRVQSIVDRTFFRRRLDYPEALRLLAAKTPEAAEPGQLALTTAETLQQAVAARTVAIFLRPYGGALLRSAAKVGLPDGALDQAHLDPASLASILTGPTASPMERYHTLGVLPALQRLKPELLVPVHSSGRLEGLISFGPKLSREPYDAEDLGFVAAAADLLRMGLENLKLREQGQDLVQAREIQRQLLPRSFPEVPGYGITGSWEPSKTVGGDYFDVLPFEDGRLALAIGDVVGKGLPAALLMSNLQAAVKALAADGRSPHDLCERLNPLVCKNVSERQFISFFYGLLEPEARKLCYTNCGHNPPILARADGSVLRLGEGGTVLGVFPGVSFGGGEVELLGGDRLVLYTDGITEAENALGESFGEGRLVDLLLLHRTESAAEIERRLLQEVAQFRAGDPADDSTILVVAVHGFAPE